jgi:hypothetical protein
VSNSIEEEIKESIPLNTKAYYANLKLSKTRLVAKQSKLKLYRTVIRPAVTYVSETWVLKETVIQKLLVFERKILRRIFGPTNENQIWSVNFNISGFHIVVLFNLSEEKVHIPSNTTK